MLINSVMQCGEHWLAEPGEAAAENSAVAAAEVADGSPQAFEISDIFIGRQPILDRKQELVAFELLFRSGRSAGAKVTGGFCATAQVVAYAFSEFGLQNALGPYRGFINIDKDLLMSDLLDVLPRKQVVLELLETVEINGDVIKRCEELRRLGYRLALDDVTEVNDRVKALLPLVDVVKIDLMQVDWAALPDIVNALKPWPLSLVAEKVDSRKQAERCMALGFQLFQGYYFARPEIIPGKRVEPSKMTLLGLLTLLLGDAELAEIELEFKRHPHLVYNLMRIVNSVACGLPKKIESLRHCIVVLGRSQLQKWVQLLLYTLGRPGGRLVSPLMQMAATRGKWMESLARGQRPGDRQYHDRAFMVGILSLLDALLGLQMSDLVSELNLADEAKAALLTRQGALGSLLLLIESKEANDLSAVSRMLRGVPDFTLARFTTTELEAAEWANGLGCAA